MSVSPWDAIKTHATCYSYTVRLVFTFYFFLHLLKTGVFTFLMGESNEVLLSVDNQSVQNSESSFPPVAVKESSGLYMCSGNILPVAILHNLLSSFSAIQNPNLSNVTTSWITLELWIVWCASFRWWCKVDLFFVTPSIFCISSIIYFNIGPFRKNLSLALRLRDIPFRPPLIFNFLFICLPVWSQPIAVKGMRFFYTIKFSSWKNFHTAGSLFLR